MSCDHRSRALFLRSYGETKFTHPFVSVARTVPSTSKPNRSLVTDGTLLTQHAVPNLTRKLATSNRRWFEGSEKNRWRRRDPTSHDQRLPRDPRGKFAGPSLLERSKRSTHRYLRAGGRTKVRRSARKSLRFSFRCLPFERPSKNKKGGRCHRGGKGGG